MKTIEWHTYLWQESIPVDDETIAALEHRWGIRFPAAYKSLLKQYQGFAPEPSTFDFGQTSDVFQCLLHTRETGPYSSYSLMDTYEELQDEVPPGVYPFADTPGGNVICFDYRHSEQPRIVHVEHELMPGENITLVANNFADFLKMLR